MEQTNDINEASLVGVTVRQRAMLKLQYGLLPLTEEELAWVLPERRIEAAAVKQRPLREVAELIGVSRERIRQINARSVKKLGLQALTETPE